VTRTNPLRTAPWPWADSKSSNLRGQGKIQIASPLHNKLILQELEFMRIRGCMVTDGMVKNWLYAFTENNVNGGISGTTAVDSEMRSMAQKILSTSRDSGRRGPSLWPSRSIVRYGASSVVQSTGDVEKQYCFGVATQYPFPTLKLRHVVLARRLMDAITPPAGFVAACGGQLATFHEYRLCPKAYFAYDYERSREERQKRKRQRLQGSSPYPSTPSSNNRLLEELEGGTGSSTSDTSPYNPPSLTSPSTSTPSTSTPSVSSTRPLLVQELPPNRRGPGHARIGISGGILTWDPWSHMLSNHIGVRDLRLFDCFQPVDGSPVLNGMARCRNGFFNGPRGRVRGRPKEIGG
ncbi:unnamed protein product, partial [Amoebophrya sp. A25]